MQLIKRMKHDEICIALFKGSIRVLGFQKIAKYIQGEITVKVKACNPFKLLDIHRQDQRARFRLEANRHLCLGRKYNAKLF